MKIEAGKFYRTRDGRKVGPMKVLNCGPYYTNRSSDDGLYNTWSQHGKAIYYPDGSTDLIAEWTDEPRTWGEMTDAEKGALLLADFRDEDIEVLDLGEWKVVIPHWSEDNVYRIKPEPVVETREGTCFASARANLGPSLWLHEIDNTVPGNWTCEAIDGVPQKITWERVND